MLKYLLVTGCFMALALTPTATTQAQRDAIRAVCRSDFMANCASVQPGGKEALQCLLRNEAKLSANCQSAVNAITSKPETSTAAPAGAPSSNKSPASAQRSSPQLPSAPEAASGSGALPTQKPPGKTRASVSSKHAPPASTPSTAAAVGTAPAVAPLGPIRPMLPRRAL